MIDLNMARRKLLAAAASRKSGMESEVILRPSSCGQCIGRLWFENQNPSPENREDKFSWMTFQGDLTEVAIRHLLREAGAEVLDPVDDPDWDVLPDSETGMLPHTDGAIYWPDIGLDEWVLLENKNLRAMACIDLILDGCEHAERLYWYQSVAYLNLSRVICKNYHWDIPPPTKTMFLLVSKDASTVNMMLNGRLQTTQKERGENPKPMTAKEQDALDWKKIKRARVEALDDPTAFYFEMIDRNDPGARRAWEDILTLPEMLSSPNPPPVADFTNDPLAKNLTAECEYYCQHRERCLEYHAENGLT